jgi:uncharacterized membrane protein HdeD (DUF308 family)
MAEISPQVEKRALPTRNLILLVAGALSLVAGYAVLSTGAASPAAVLLVLGYCVLIPLGIAL